MLKGHIDRLTNSLIMGWALETENPASVDLIVTDGDELLGRVTADVYRADLERAGLGAGRHSFTLVFDRPLSLFVPHVIRVRREMDGKDIPGSPATLRPPESFDATAKAAVNQLLARSESKQEIIDKIDFLVEETDRLVQQLADSDKTRRENSEDAVRRWRWRQPAMGGGEGAGSDNPPTTPSRALVIDEVTPMRGRDAGSNAILAHIESLQRLGYEISFTAAWEFHRRGDRDQHGALEDLGVSTFCAPYYGSVEEVMLRNAEAFDLIYLHRLSSAARYGDLARSYFTKAKLVYSVADLHHLRLARQGQAEARPELVQLSRVLQRREYQAMAAADSVITHSTYEAQLIRRHLPADRVHVVAWPAPRRETKVPFADRHAVAFIGSYGHQPNVDAASWLIREIMPIVRASDPAIECLLVGANLPKNLQQACGDGCIAMGAVDDLAHVFDDVRLTVAPLAYGAGIKGKVLDSLAAGIPCICTPVAAEGLELPAALQPCMASDAAGIAAAIVRLHTEAALNEACSKAGLAHVKARFNEATVDAAMRTACR